MFSIWQRELDRVSIGFTTLYIQLLCGYAPLSPMVSMLLVKWLLCHIPWLWLVTFYCDVTILWPLSHLCDTVTIMWYFPTLYSSNKEKKRKRKEILNNNLAVLSSYDISCIVSLKEKKRNINNDLAILPSHDRIRL